jgi:RimJ/RimL family protein N-acetyltransferase
MHKVRLRHATEEDYQGILKFATDKDVSKLLTWQPHAAESETKRYFAKILKADSYPDETLIIEADGHFAGTIHCIARDDRHVQFGFGLLPQYWHRGIGTKAVDQALEYLAITAWRQKMTELWADTHASNEHAIRILIRAGFQRLDAEISPSRQRYILRYE